MERINKVQTILDLTGSEALDYFMTSENYCNLPLPSYFDFQPILDYTRKIINKRELKECIIDKMPSKYDGVNYKILMNKDGKFSYRPIQVVNPYLYYLLVRFITENQNWSQLKKRFDDFKNPHTEVASVPTLKSQNDKTKTATSINIWWDNIEQRSIELSIRYKYMFQTDITNCYESIYTHTINWAIDGKEHAKSNIGKKSLGSTIDSYIQGMQYGQTNGIPQGSALFDFIAEIVLGYADELLDKRLNEINVTDYKILRYRDDYRIYSKSKDELEKIVLELHSILSNLNFKMNPFKTGLTSNIIEESIKPDKLFYLSNLPIYKKGRTVFDSLQKELLFILLISKKYPNSGTVIKLLMTFCHRIQKRKEIKENATVLIAVLLDITLKSPKAYQQTLACISFLLYKFKFEESVKNIISEIYSKLKTLPNIGHIQIWLQRITYPVDRQNDGEIPYDELLCKIVNGEKISLWNLDWLKPELYVDLPIERICDCTKRDSMTSFIKADEVDIFEY